MVAGIEPTSGLLDWLRSCSENQTPFPKLTSIGWAKLTTQPAVLAREQKRIVTKKWHFDG